MNNKGQSTNLPLIFTFDITPSFIVIQETRTELTLLSMPSLNLDTPRESNSGNIVNETSINDSEHLSDCMFERENVPDFQVKCSGFVL